MRTLALSVIVLWSITAFTAADVSAQTATTNAVSTVSNMPCVETFSFGPSRLKDLIIQTNEDEPTIVHKSPMTVSNGVWYCTFVSNDQSRQAWRQSCSKIAMNDFNKVGEIGFFGKKFAVTEGPPVVNMNPLPDANRDETLREKARRVELGDGLFMSEKDGFGYRISKNLSVSAKSTSKIELGFRF
jgi:hypothetical protein